MKEYKDIAEKLLKSDNPSIRWKIRANVFEETIDSKALKSLSQEIKGSSIVQSLLQNQLDTGKIKSKSSVYDKWQGAHWILATLADIGYPQNDDTLNEAKNAVIDTWLSSQFYTEFKVTKKSDVYKNKGVPVMGGRHRRCASQQGYALYYLIALGLLDDRLHDLAERLMHWQWPDGGWNCDKRPEAAKSSFIETALPMRGLYKYAIEFDHKIAKENALRASEVFLRRFLYKRATDGRIISNEFVNLHYPLYWHYDILGILKILAEMGLVEDERCKEGLNLLLSKFIKGEGWPAEKKYYKTSKELNLGNDYIDWGGTSKKKGNDWVTADALYVLKKAKAL